MRGARLLFHSGLLVFSLLPAAICALALSAAGPGWAAVCAMAVVVSIQLLGLPAEAGRSPALLNRLLRISSAFLRLIPRIDGSGLHPVERMIVSLNDRSLLRRAPLEPRPRRVLLLLPHCLQQHDCPHRLLSDASACRRCGKCAIGPLADLAEGRGAKLAIATGGTSARKAVRTAAPDLVVAVACARDLSSGILDSWPVPAWGELNAQPFGECYDTTVDTAAVARSLEALLG